jgi:hypothetical protein
MPGIDERAALRPSICAPPSSHRRLSPYCRERSAAMARFLIILGVALVVAGLLWPWISRLGLGRLPGDISISGEYGSLYIPITTSILLSIVLSLVLWLMSR